MSWIQTSYLIAEVIAIPLTGWLTRILSMRWLFTAAIAFFTLASIGCAASDSFAMLVSFRVVQGFAGGTLIPTVFAAVFILFRPRTQGIATTIAGIMAVLAPTVGPVVGGWITQVYSWHWLFLINVIPGLIACVVTPYLFASEKYQFRRSRARWLVTVSIGGRARMPGDRAQAVAARWMVLLHLHKLVFS